MASDWGRGLRDDLTSCQFRSFGGEVGITDRGLGRGGVLKGHPEVPDGRTDDVLGERPRRPRRLEICLIDRSTMVWAFVRSPLTTFPTPPDFRPDRNPSVVVPRLPVVTVSIPSETLEARLTCGERLKSAPPPVT